MKKALLKINKLLCKKFGLPKQNKPRTDPLDALVATILSQNTTDKNSYQAYQNLRNSFNTWEEVAAANQKTIEQKIRIGGLAKQKAKAIKTLLNELKRQNGKTNLEYLSKLSNNEIIKELTKFNGVGVKTASCVLLFSLNRNICPVDTHVHRVLNRIGIVNTKSPDKTFEMINKFLPEGIGYSLHTNLIKLGRDICKASKPICSVCPLLAACKFPSKNFDKTNKSQVNHFLLLDNV